MMDEQKREKTYIYVCVCMCVCIHEQRDRDREREKHICAELEKEGGMWRGRERGGKRNICVRDG